MYVGIAVSSFLSSSRGSVTDNCKVSYAVYQHKTYRLLTIYRGSLIALVFNKTLKMDLANITDAEAITLMSADIDRIGHSLPLIHELYASVTDIAIALWLLYGRLGVAMVAPIIWIICKLKKDASSGQVYLEQAVVAQMQDRALTCVSTDNHWPANRRRRWQCTRAMARCD